MVNQRKNNKLGLLLRGLLKERSLSMRKFSDLTGIDTATISRIINGKRKANLQHLQKFADCLNVPISELLNAGGYGIQEQEERPQSDIQKSVEVIQNYLESSNLLDKEFTIKQVDEELSHYGHYSETEEGKETILKGFEKKLQKIGSIGPFINDLKELYETFRQRKGTSYELAIIGSALLYFIITVDAIPDYIFPIGYIDDAIAVQIVLNSLAE
ncbi:helix-turn-helix domain-containing protein [Siminovitchia sp. 179-K 8D1 HS]|uniref:helix-turn-helix domain-containing protein n=1 Tax=Siminovitchia sp. 179-K 8D1 HS TaxID=3142385 RepID=UPI0039A2CCEB